MKKNIVLGLVLALIVGGLALRTHAENNDENSSSTSTSTVSSTVKIFRENDREDNHSSNQAPGLVINATGNVSVKNANLDSISGNTLAVSVFGIHLSVNTANAKLFVPNASGTATGTMNIGDKLAIQGMIDSSSGVINAREVRDLSALDQNRSALQDRIRQLEDMIKTLLAQYHGLFGGTHQGDNQEGGNHD